MAASWDSFCILIAASCFVTQGQLMLAGLIIKFEQPEILAPPLQIVGDIITDMVPHLTIKSAVFC